MNFFLNVNGKPATIDADDPQMPLLYALGDDLACTGPSSAAGSANAAGERIKLAAGRVSIRSMPR